MDDGSFLWAPPGILAKALIISKVHVQNLRFRTMSKTSELISFFFIIFGVSKASLEEKWLSKKHFGVLRFFSIYT